MSNWAKPGVQCVCIKDDWGCLAYQEYRIPTRVPMINEVLTVSTVCVTEDGRVMLSFAEIPLRQQAGPIDGDIMYNVACFRPLIKRKTDISIFTRMLTDAGKLVDA